MTPQWCLTNVRLCLLSRIQLRLYEYIYDRFCRNLVRHETCSPAGDYQCFGKDSGFNFKDCRSLRNDRNHHLRSGLFTDTVRRSEHVVSNGLGRV
jgi:hypothetical protein